MKKNRIENFLATLGEKGVLKDNQQSMVMGSELELLGCGTDGPIENPACGVLNKQCTMNVICPLPPTTGNIGCSVTINNCTPDTGGN